MDKDKTPTNEATPQFIKRGEFAITPEYRQWLTDLKQRLQQSQIKAAIKVNRALLEFYWQLGHDIVALKAEQAWGSGVLQQLSLDLRDAFPEMKGLSYTNIKYASQWYRFYNQGDIIRQQVVGEFGQQVIDELEMPEKFAYIPWGHHIQIFAHSKSLDEAYFYINKVIEGNWSRVYLSHAIQANLYAQQGKAITNFTDLLPQPQDVLALDILKDPYNLDFIRMRSGYSERELEDALAHNISRFLLELGKGFAFVGRQIELRMHDGKSYFPDMIFYHTKLKCYVVMELKVVPFEPEFVGKLNFYVTAADELLKDESDNPTIGLLVCKSKDETTVKWAFRGISTPMGVASYELQEVLDQTLSTQLPSIEEIENAVEEKG